MREPIPAEHIGTFFGRLECARPLAARFCLHELGAQTVTCGTTNDGVNDPVRAPWGQGQGTATGSFTPSLVQWHRHGHSSGEAAQSAASLSLRAATYADSSVCLRFVLMGSQGGERVGRGRRNWGANLTRFSLGPPSWPTRHGPSRR